MSTYTTISWAHHTFNPWWGCQRVSAACEHCYAETFAKRLGYAVWGPPATTPRRMASARYWAEPYRWDAVAQRAGERHRVFCASMADVFEDHPDVAEARARLWATIDATPFLDWLLLTKRPENIRRMVPPSWLATPRRHVWMGVTVEHQEAAMQRIPLLWRVPAYVRFLSCEPLLRPVDLLTTTTCPHCNGSGDGEYGTILMDDCLLCHGHGAIPLHTGLHWVIAGGESGGPAERRLVSRCFEMSHQVMGQVHGPCSHCYETGWRPTPPALAWARALRDQCQAASIPFFWKQWGGPRPTSGGRLLDSRTWDEVPVVAVP